LQRQKQAYDGADEKHGASNIDVLEALFDRKMRVLALRVGEEEEDDNERDGAKG